jgi:hypothetical protein
VAVNPYTENEILTYTISGQAESNKVEENDSIHVTMNEAIDDISTRKAEFTISDNATIFVGTIPQVSNETLNNFTDGPVFYTVIAEDGTSREWQVVVDFHDYNVGISTIDANDNLKIYPNPNQGKFILELNMDNIKTINLEVVNAQGQVVANFNNMKTNVSQSIDLTELATGIYYIKVYTGKEFIIKKVNILN